MVVALNTRIDRPPNAATTLERAASALLVVGPLLSVAGGRWGSYIGVNSASLYLSDIFVGVGVLCLIVAQPHGWRVPTLGRYFPPLFTFSAVIALGLIRTSVWNVETLQDLAPFVYLLFAPYFVIAVRTVGGARVLQWVGVAAAIHLLWFVPASFGALGTISVPGFVGIPIFTTRGDFDLVITGVALVWLASSTTFPRPLRIVGILAALAAILTAGSRAGLLSAVLIAVIVAAYQKPWRLPLAGPLLVAGLFLSIAATGAMILLSPGLPEWAVTLGRLLGQGDEALNAQNTLLARLDAWRLIWEYMSSDAVRLMFGEGFGASVIAESGALAHLSGDPTVREAHNFLITWLGQVGIVGTALVGLAVFRMVLSALRAVRHYPSFALSPALAAGLLLAALMGVIMESPFGYQTFVLAYAIALSTGGFSAPNTVPDPYGAQAGNHVLSTPRFITGSAA
jgi:O-antigen ligase